MGATHESHGEKVAAYVAAVLIPVAIYVAIWQLHGWAVFPRLGFVVIVPSVIGSTVAAVMNARR